MKKDKKEFARYERQILLPEIGIEGQEKLLAASVLVIGAGGLGSPVLQYLAAAGVGRIGIADADTVSESNLHRQILHPMKNIGKNKAESAAERLKELNPNVKRTLYPEYITPDNISEIIKDYDFIIDAVDNFESKFLINDACVLEKKPFCHAGVIQFHGQVMTYVPGQGPCYRCIFEDIPEKESIPTSAQVGVMGPVCGIIGCTQALEAIKYITGSGKLLTGAMWIYDALNLTSRIAKFSKCSSKCRVCGPKADILDVRTNAKDYL